MIDALEGDRGLFFDPATGAEIEYVQWADTATGLLVRYVTDAAGLFVVDYRPGGGEALKVGERRPFRFERAI